MPSYLITGSSRGLGLGFVTELLKDPGNIVIATARDPTKSAGLQELKKKHGYAQLHLVSLDVTKSDSVHDAAEATQKLLPDGLDYIISNAGVNYSPLKSPRCIPQAIQRAGVGEDLYSKIRWFVGGNLHA
ncbi:short-chain dehydrogenases/reductase [Apiospora hydei]|uniref:Short-chain dehydrogenases/reductase n=1 Tax=Apiospora hydei TaxID=1337664 RepID=A0ABR1XBV2_9PEZI